MNHALHRHIRFLVVISIILGLILTIAITHSSLTLTLLSFFAYFVWSISVHEVEEALRALLHKDGR